MLKLGLQVQSGNNRTSCFDVIRPGSKQAMKMMPADDVAPTINASRSDETIAGLTLIVLVLAPLVKVHLTKGCASQSGLNARHRCARRSSGVFNSPCRAMKPGEA